MFSSLRSRSRNPRLQPKGIRRADYATPLYPQKLALTSPTNGCRSVGIVRSRTQAMEFISHCEVNWPFNLCTSTSLLSGTAHSIGQCSVCSGAGRQPAMQLCRRSCLACAVFIAHQANSSRCLAYVLTALSTKMYVV
jgi:hypothetical protein